MFNEILLPWIVFPPPHGFSNVSRRFLYIHYMHSWDSSSNLASFISFILMKERNILVNWWISCHRKHINYITWRNRERNSRLSVAIQLNNSFNDIKHQVTMEKDDIVTDMSLGNRLCDFSTYSSSFFAPSSIQMTSKISGNFHLSHARSKFFDSTRFFLGKTNLKFDRFFFEIYKIYNLVVFEMVKISKKNIF